MVRADPIVRYETRRYPHDIALLQMANPNRFPFVYDMKQICSILEYDPMLLKYCAYVIDYHEMTARGIEHKYIHSIVKENCERASLVAININPRALKYAPIQSIEVCCAALTQNVHLIPLLLSYIRDEQMRKLMSRFLMIS